MLTIVAWSLATPAARIRLALLVALLLALALAGGVAPFGAEDAAALTIQGGDATAAR